MISIGINNGPQHFGNDWGLFVDIENPKNFYLNNNIIHKYYSKKEETINNNIDDEYSYNIKINKNIEYKDNLYAENNIIYQNKSKYNFGLNKNKIIKIGSASFVTAMLTYFILFLL
jgi:hypothetical protein